MWQRFTERARKVVYFAQQEAEKYGEGFVSTEHLLLGLTLESDGVASRVFERLGISQSRIRAEIEKQLPLRQTRPNPEMSLTPRAKRVIDLAYNEARNLKNDYIGTEHLLLGLISESDGLVGRVLAHLGVEFDEVRREVISIQDDELAKKGIVPPERKIGSAKGRPAKLARHALRIFPWWAKSSNPHVFSAGTTSIDFLTLLMAEERGKARRLLAGLDVKFDDFLNELNDAVLRQIGSQASQSRDAPPEQGPRDLDSLFSRASEIAAELGHTDTGSDHLILALIALGNSDAAKMIQDAGITLDQAKAACVALRKEPD